MVIIYNIDTEKEVTPLMVRDAIVQCFFEAHCADAGLNTEDKATNQMYCRSEVERAFADAGADFDKPTKEGIMAAMEKLVEFSRNFRDPSLIQKHYDEIATLLGALK